MVVLEASDINAFTTPGRWLLSKSSQIALQAMMVVLKASNSDAFPQR